MDWVAGIVAVISMAMSAYAAHSQGKRQEAMSQYNALIARQNADLELQKADLQKSQTRIAAKRQKEETEKFKSKQRSLYGKTGAQIEGSLLEGLVDTAEEGAITEAAIMYAGSVEEADILSQSFRYKQEEKLAKMRGSDYRSAGRMGVASELLSGIGQFVAKK